MSRPSQSFGNYRPVVRDVDRRTQQTATQETRVKSQSGERESHSNTAVRLGEYFRQREFSREKLLHGQIKSAQLLSDEDPVTKEVKFKKQNINRLYEKIAIEVGRRKSDLTIRSLEELSKEESFMEDILRMLVSTKPGDACNRYSSAETSTISTAPPTVASYAGVTNFYSHKILEEDSKDGSATRYPSYERPSQDYFHKDRTPSKVEGYKKPQRKVGIVEKQPLNTPLQSVTRPTGLKGSVSQQQLNHMKPPIAPKKS